MPAVVLYSNMILLPPTRAASDSPFTRARCARCDATNEDEHAVSVLMHGPSKAKAYERRPTMYGGPLPMNAWEGSLEPVRTWTSIYSWYMQPMYTPAWVSIFRPLANDMIDLVLNAPH